MMDELEFVYRLLLDAQEIALRRGDKYGLCDCIDNNGKPYPSQALYDALNRAIDYTMEVDKRSPSPPVSGAADGRKVGT